VRRGGGAQVHEYLILIRMTDPAVFARLTYWLTGVEKLLEKTNNRVTNLSQMTSFDPITDFPCQAKNLQNLALNPVDRN